MYSFRFLSLGFYPAPVFLGCLSCASRWPGCWPWWAWYLQLDAHRVKEEPERREVRRQKGWEASKQIHWQVRSLANCCWRLWTVTVKQRNRVVSKKVIRKGTGSYFNHQGPLGGSDFILNLKAWEAPAWGELGLVHPSLRNSTLFALWIVHFMDDGPRARLACPPREGHDPHLPGQGWFCGSVLGSHVIETSC